MPLTNLTANLHDFANSKPVVKFLNKNKYHYLDKVTFSILHWNLNIPLATSSIWIKEFQYADTSIWMRIYFKKTICLTIPKLRDFNYKLLHNVVPNGKCYLNATFYR